MPSENCPHWQLPPGVTRGLWDYVHSQPIADDYDDYFAHNRLFQFDEQLVLRELELRGIGSPALVADLGCGTGRAIVALARMGYRGLAVDLSEPMLNVVREKSLSEHLPIHCLKANLVQLTAVADESVDAAISLFSTLGMIRGRENRQQALHHAYRILKPKCPIVLHVHNYWYNLYDPSGPWWLLGNLSRAALTAQVEVGDKYFEYRGVPNMFLHVFRPGELRQALLKAGFRVRKIIPLDRRRNRSLRCPWLLRRLRANGWIAVADRPGSPE